LSKNLITRGHIWSKTWPLIFANALIPLVGVADTMVIGLSGSATDLAGVALGSAVFAIFYWGTYSLRQSTTGLVAQAIGRDDHEQSQLVLVRSGLLALVIGVLILLFKLPLSELSFSILQGSEAAEATGKSYVNWRFYGAPAAISLFALTGWMIGAGLSKMAMLVQVFLATVNVILDLWFVLGLNWGPAGVAAGTSIAEALAFLLAIGLLVRHIRKTTGFHLASFDHRQVFNLAPFIHLLSVNRDLFIRSGCMIIGFTWFINSGAKQGDALLAGNQVLLQFITVWAFILDAFAYTAEAETGRAVGKKSRRSLDQAVRFTSEYAIVVALVCAALTLFAGPVVLRAIIVDSAARAAALLYLPWCAAVPVLGVAAWQLDGIFVGATRSAAMRNSALVSVLVYLMADFFLSPVYGNSGVWAAFLIYYVTRGVTLATAWPALRRSVQTG